MNITIPPEALEAGARAVALENGHDIDYYSDRLREHCFAQARAAFTAMVKAWPGMETSAPDPWSAPDRLILPLPQEKPDGE